MDEFVVILITCSSLEEAEKITKTLVSEHLIACGNMVPGIRSIFYWKNQVSEENEVLVICKSMGIRFEQIVKRVKSLHHYTVPEIIAIPLTNGSSDYLNWIRDTVQIK